MEHLQNLKLLLKWSISTRVLFFTLQVVVSLIPDHKSNDAFLSRTAAHPRLIEFLFGGFDNWDSQYYIHISQYWYDNEPSYAFFPLYPLLMRVLSQCLYVTPLGSLAPFHTISLISGVVISNVSFIIAAGVLYFLTISVFSTSISTSIKPLLNLSLNIPLSQPMVQHLATLTVLMFSINPATVFMSAVYTESLFVCLTFSGILLICYCKVYIAAVLFAFASCTRSNGIVLAGFIAYHHLINLVNQGRTQSISRTGLKIMEMLLQIFIVFGPFVIFQMYSYTKLCSNTQSPPTSLCVNQYSLPYTYIQRKYWNVGFLEYYRFKQIPNFLLALPMIILSGIAIWRYVSKSVSDLIERVNGMKNSLELAIDSVLLPYMVQLSFLLVFGICFMHVQVITRFICSSSPVIYWFVAITTVGTINKQMLLCVNSITEYLYVFKHLLCSKVTSIRLIIIYFLVFNLVGFIMHCNFLPWT